MDDREREKFYSASKNVPDDEEYELEPLDEAAEARRSKAALDAIESRVDIDEIYREADRNRGSEILENWVRNFRFQFQVKHLLIATAVLAIVLTLAKLQLFWTALIILFMLSVFGLTMYLSSEDKKQQAEADRKRQLLYARRRAQTARASGAHVVGEPEIPEEIVRVDIARPPDDVERAWQEARSAAAFRFQFSLRELIITMTVAAAVLGMVRVLGSPATTATVLGLIALFGLMVYALGFEPPQIVVLGWWLTLVLYVVVSIFAAVWSGFA